MMQETRGVMIYKYEEINDMCKNQNEWCHYCE